MESYIEITFINNVLISLLSFYASVYFSLSKTRHSVFIFFIVIEQMLHLILPEKGFYLFILYEIIIYFYLLKRQIKVGLMYLAIKYMLMFTMFKFLKGSFYFFHYYVPIDIHVIFVWIIMIFLILLLKEKWNCYLNVSDFIYDVTFMCKPKLKLKGFLDTGNNVIIEGIPVLFVDFQYKEIFSTYPLKKTYIHTFNNSKMVDVYLCLVLIHGYKKELYYICCDERIALEFDCRCLLNIEM